MIVLAISACENSVPGTQSKAQPVMTENQYPTPHYILENEIITQPGQRAAFIALLKAGTRDMPGNYVYDITADKENPDRIVITEVWDSAKSHQNSLSLPQVRAAIAEGRPMIASMQNLSTTGK